MIEQFILLNQGWIIPLLLLWTLPWKGVALWRASRSGQKKWFIALLVINALAILDIVYIFFFSKKEEKSV